jgi:hypothetical protein
MHLLLLIEPLTIFSLSVVAVLDHRYLLKHWPMKELGIALERRRNLLEKYVLIPWAMKGLTFEDISKAAKDKDEPNLYSDIEKWEGVKWAADDDLKKLRRSVPPDDISTWRSSLEALTGIGILRPDQVNDGENDGEIEAR